MIPGLLASEVAAALREFIVSGFETETPPFNDEFRRNGEPVTNILLPNED